MEFNLLYSGAAVCGLAISSSGVGWKSPKMNSPKKQACRDSSYNGLLCCGFLSCGNNSAATLHGELPLMSWSKCIIGPLCTLWHICSHYYVYYLHFAGVSYILLCSSKTAMQQQYFRYIFENMISNYFFQWGYEFRKFLCTYMEIIWIQHIFQIRHSEKIAIVKH